MRAIAACLALAIFVAPAAQAQDGPRVPFRKGASAEEIAVLTSNAVFKDIKLDPDQQSKALEIIRASRVAASKLDPAAADFPKRSAEVARDRNIKLRTLLRSDADRVRFDENVKTYDPKKG